MKIYFDTSKKDSLILKVDGRVINTASHEKNSQLLLPLLVDELQKKKSTVWDITSIELNPGPGSFTGLRVGASIAQTLAWSVDVSVNGEKLTQGKFINIIYK